MPASTLKILTSLVAFHYLGNDYRFVTRLYLDDAGNLKIRGSGDPLLTSESFLEIAQALTEGPEPKLSAIGDLVMDPSYFAPSIAVPGKGNSSQPYDAPIGALCANFNTVAFRKDKRRALRQLRSPDPAAAGRHAENKGLRLEARADHPVPPG